MSLNIRVPSVIDPSWRIESGLAPREFCLLCKEELSEGGCGEDNLHTLEDCIRNLRTRIERLEAR